MPELDDVYKSSAIIYGEEREHYDDWFADASMELHDYNLQISERLARK